MEGVKPMKRRISILTLLCILLMTMTAAARATNDAALPKNEVATISATTELAEALDMKTMDVVTADVGDARQTTALENGENDVILTYVNLVNGTATYSGYTANMTAAQGGSDYTAAHLTDFKNTANMNDANDAATQTDFKNNGLTMGGQLST